MHRNLFRIGIGKTGQRIPGFWERQKNLGSVNPKRGQLYRLKKDASGKARPIIIVSNNTLNGGHSVVAIPFYSQQLEKRRKQAWCAYFQAGAGGLDKSCVAKTDEVTLIDKLDIDIVAGPIGEFDKSQLSRVKSALKWTLSLD